MFTLRTGELLGLWDGVMEFVFQTFNLIPTLTARANVEVPILYRGVQGSQPRQMALSALEDTASATGKVPPSQISGSIHYHQSQHHGGRDQ